MKWLFASLVLICSAIYAQSETEIFVKNEQGLFINSVALYVENTSNSNESYRVSTDKEGKVTLVLKKNSNYSIIGLHDDYLPFDTIVSFTSAPIIITLKKINELEEVVIKSTKKLVTLKKGKFIIDTNNEVLKSLPNTWEALKNSPIVVADENGSISLGSKSATIYINNKEVLLSGEELKTYLENISVDEIKNFELNTNPNASYDSRVQSVINIKLKKTNKRKQQFSIRSNNGIRTKTYSSNSLGYKFTTSKFRFNSRASYNYSDRMYTNEIIQNTGQLNSEEKEINKNSTLSLNADMDITDKQWLDVSIFYNNKDSKSNSETLGLNRSILSDTENTSERINANLLYLITINDSTSIDLRADYATARSDVQNLIEFSGNDLSGINDYEQFIPTKIPIIRVASNFIKDKENGGYSFGMKYSNIDVSNKNKERDVLTSQTIFGDFDYLENVYASYINKEFSWDNYFLSLGLRGELTTIETTFINQDNQTLSNTFDYFNLIPNATLNILTEKEEVYTIGLTSSVSRPSYNLLNPFNTFESDILEFQGDAELSPQQQYSFELGYTYKYHGLLFQASYIDDLISTFITNTNGQLITRYSNFNDVYVVSLNYSFQKKVTNFWRSSIKTSLLQVFVNDDRFDIQDATPNFEIQINNNIKINKRLRYNLNLEFSSKFSDGFFRHRQAGSIYTSLTYRLKDPNLYFGLYADDIFKTDLGGAEVLLPNVSYNTREFNDTFIVGLNIIYKIGKEFKKNRKINKDTFDEYDRIK